MVEISWGWTQNFSGEVIATAKSTNENVLTIKNDAGTDIFAILNTGGSDGWLELRNDSGTRMVVFRADGGNHYLNTGSICVGSTTVDASALVEIESTTKGFLPPRMTTTQKNAIGSPATGLIVFDTTLGKLQVYGGAGWINLH